MSDEVSGYAATSSTRHGARVLWVKVPPPTRTGVTFVEGVAGQLGVAVEEPQAQIGVCEDGPLRCSEVSG